MEAKLVKSTELYLKLNELEAKWLKGAMQNPIHNEHPDNESEFNKIMRKKLWDALEDIEI